MKATFIVFVALVVAVGCGKGGSDLTAQPELEKAIRIHLKTSRGSMPTGKLTKEDFNKVMELDLSDNKLTEAPLAGERWRPFKGKASHRILLTPVKLWAI